ncbi:hypothetical protein V865_006861 [Kwoniella europaea PYCC6329]|uniref:RING-type domain-containing protein n=1 Tax=Kwoniella europaea PYCC6329 TaxID=1423913 RepID=A0AAX4KSQ5_9TREE
MPASVASQSSLFSRGDIFANLPPGTYHTSDDTSDDDVMALDEAPEHLRKITNKDAPIVVDSSSDEDEPPTPTRAGPSTSNRRNQDSDDEPPVRVSQRRNSSRSPANRRKSTTVPRSQQTSAAIHSALPSSSPVAGPSTPRSYLAEDHLNHVLEILPDIDSEWALGHINQEMVLRKDDNPANRVVEIALEMEGGYPKLNQTKKGKGKEKSPVVAGQREGYRNPIYRSDERIGMGYCQKGVSQLEEDFPLIPAHYVRTVFHTMQTLYVPAYFRLLEHSKLPAKPYVELKRGRNTGKGKYKAKQVERDDLTEEDQVQDVGSEEFEKEVKWLRRTLATEQSERDAAEARRVAEEEALAGGAGIECGCCFCDTLPRDMIQCTEGHLFCRECASKHAETKLGEQSTSILCMDQSDCTSPFPESELTRCLSEKSIQLYHRLKQAKELEQAEIEGLESCPSCPYATIIDNPDEKLFRCMNEECGQVTCRGCRKKEHIPKTCAEVEADLKLNNRHTVEDAMSEALIRRCPTCLKPYIKDSGCNKISCGKCGTLSCYVCQKVITGYEHFDQVPRASGQPRQPNKCILWDQNERQHDDQAIRAARDQAAARVLAAAQENGVDLNADDINVALPDAPLAMAAGAGPVPMARYVPPAGVAQRWIPAARGGNEAADQRFRDAWARMHDVAPRVNRLLELPRRPGPLYLPPFDNLPAVPNAGPHFNLNNVLPRIDQGLIGRAIAPLPHRRAPNRPILPIDEPDTFNGDDWDDIDEDDQVDEESNSDSEEDEEAAADLQDEHRIRNELRVREERGQINTERQEERRRGAEERAERARRRGRR